MSHEERSRAGDEAQARLVALLPFDPRSTMAFYAATAREVPTDEVFRRARTAGVRCVFPSVTAGTRVLAFREVRALETLVPSPGLKLLEPRGDEPLVALEDIDIFLVPGQAFSLDGARLGHGGGAYDATLTLAAGWRVAVGWDCALVERLPVEPTDVPMDALVTELRTEVWRPAPSPRR